MFSFQGFRQGIQYAGESRDPRRHVPVAIFGSIGLALVIYLALQTAFIGAVPGSALAGGWSGLRYENAFGPFAGIALILGLTWLAVILYVDAVISPAGAGLIWAGEATRMAYGVGRNERRLAILAWVNRNGVPWVSVTVSMVVSALLLLPFPSWQRLVGFSTSTGVLMSACCCVALGCVRRQFPQQRRPFRLKGGDAIPLLAFFAANCVTLWSEWSTNWKTVTVVGVGYVLLALSRVRGERGQQVRLRLRSASWLVPWLGGMLVVSWLSTFGGIEALGTGVSLLLTAVVSVVAYACGVAVRLPQEAAAAQLGDQFADSPAQSATRPST
ncbi:MAG: APC family permease [Streptosporangiales bacterium]